MLILAAISFVGMLAWWSYRKLQAQRETRGRLDAEAGFQRRLERDPGNTAAYEGLGDSYRAGGRLAEALAAYGQALDAAGDHPGAVGVQYKIRQIQMEIDATARKRGKQPPRLGAGKARDLLACIHCGAANGLADRMCAECGNELLHDTMRSALMSYWTDGKQRREMLEASAVMAIPVLCIAFAAHLSLEIKGVLIISTVIVGGWVFLNSFSGDRH